METLEFGAFRKLEKKSEKVRESKGKGVLEK